MTTRKRKGLRRRVKKPGASPGTLVHLGDRKLETVRISLIDYNETELQERALSRIEEALPFKEKPSVTWVNVDGLHDVAVVARIGELFELHPLLLEDILNSEQRPKIEDFDAYIFVVLKMLSPVPEKLEIQSEQVSLILGPNFVLSFQESVGDVFDPIRQRIRSDKGRIRKMGPDYLAYALIDAIVDHYFTILERLSDQVELLEDEVIAAPEPPTLHKIHNLKRELIYLRKSVWPLREVVSFLVREESELIEDRTRIFLRDVYDHTIQVIDNLEALRDTLGGLLDVYLSSLSNRMNEVMKVLTIIATIFIPLTFIAGVYGMNFEYMPELHVRWAYPAIWLLMSLVALLMLWYFRRKKWL